MYTIYLIGIIKSRYKKGRYKKSRYKNTTHQSNIKSPFTAFFKVTVIRRDMLSE